MISIDEAMKAVAQMELMAYFNLSPEARLLAGKELMAMVNWPASRILRNALDEVIPYVEPKERLAWLVRQLRKVGTWPGMSEIRGLYCLRFVPADGIEAPCNLEGVTDDGVFVGAGSEMDAFPPAPEQLYIPGPDDVPVGDLMASIAGAAKRLGSGK